MLEHTRNVHVPTGEVILTARLPFGIGLVGERGRLNNQAEVVEFANQLDQFACPLTITNTADCVDDRPIIAMGNNETDPEVIDNRVAYQLPGGLGLAITKAAVGANVDYLKDVTNFKEAYLKTVDRLVELGYQEAGHKDCGASAAVEKSVINELSEDQLMVALPALTTIDERTDYYLERNWETKHVRLQEGFYSGWKPGWHEDFLAENFPENFSILAEDANDHDTHGHNAVGLFIIQTAGYGFAKTAFTRAFGQMAFGMTTCLSREIVPKLVASTEEQNRLELELGVDAPHVLNGLIVSDFPTFLHNA